MDGLRPQQAFALAGCWLMPEVARSVLGHDASPPRGRRGARAARRYSPDPPERPAATLLPPRPRPRRPPTTGSSRRHIANTLYYTGIRAEDTEHRGTGARRGALEVPEGAKACATGCVPPRRSDRRGVGWKSRRGSALARMNAGLAGSPLPPPDRAEVDVHYSGSPEIAGSSRWIRRAGRTSARRRRGRRLTKPSRRSAGRSNDRHRRGRRYWAYPGGVNVTPGCPTL